MPDDPKPPDSGRGEIFGTMQLPPGADPRDLIATTPPPTPPHPAAATPIAVTLRPRSGDSMPSLPPPALPEIARYTLGDEIARGGMGRVVDATDSLLGRTVAFKEALSSDADALRRFARETRITARLEHPSIVPVHDAGVSPNGQPFYVMRKIGGQPLEKLVGEAETLPQRLALIPHIVASARAIAHAHARGIVHRDIKPSNILAGELGETIVIDWGLAKVIGEADDIADAAAAASLGVEPLHTRVGVVFGTPGFMSPEQLRGAPVDEQCDVYALGATLYHLLARRPPHYAKTADEMMRAAVAAPPTPVSELVAGVPPELETIVAKALAQTAEARYASSRALAEDLQRFLTGQLVAAHRYSRTERLRRFVKQHRVELIIAATALVTIIVLSAGFIHRIIAERDRADMEAREAVAQRNAATERADQLVLQQARVLVGRNPTAALALLAPLASSPRWWPQVRAIGAAARAAGIAHVLPASARTTGLELAHDGTHLLATGEDGVVRLHDLRAGTARVIAELHGRALAHLTGDDRLAVLASGARLSVVDLATPGPPRTLDTAARLATLEVVGSRAYWVDVDRAGWSLDVATPGAHPVRLASPEPLGQIVPSPDGLWLAVVGASHLFVLDRSDPDAQLVALTETAVRTIAWTEDSRGFTALLKTDILMVATGETPGIVRRLDVGERAAVTMMHDDPYVVGPTGVAIPTRNGIVERKQLAGYALGICGGPNGVVIAGAATGTLAVMSAAGDPVLATPSGGLTGFTAAPQSPYVVGASDGVLYVWTLADVLPRQITGTPPAAAELVDDTHVLAAYVHRAAEWIDLTRDTSTTLGELPDTVRILPAPDGARAAVTDLAHQLRIVAPGQAPVRAGDEVTQVGYLADGRLAVATAAGIRLRTTAPAQETGVGPARGPAALATHGTRLAAAYADGALWRLDLATGAEERGATGGTAAPRALAVADDGTVLFASSTELRAWLPAGAIVTVAPLARPVRELHVLPGGRVLALADTAAYAIDVTGRAVVATLPLTSVAVAVADDAGLVVVRTTGGVLEVIDAFAGPSDGVRWTLASAQDVVFSPPRITRDGRRVLASTPGGLFVWALDLPASAETTEAWLAALAASPPGPR